MATTTVYAWPYPTATDAPDGATQMQNLAQAIETTVNTIETTKIPSSVIAFTTLTLSGTGVTDGGYRRVKRHASGLVELQLRLNITTSSLNAVVATLPSWAWPTNGDKSFQAATNNQAGATARLDVSATNGQVTVRFNNLSGSGLFVEINQPYTP